MLRRAAYVLFVLAFAFSPFVVANAPPVPIAQVQPEAVLREPVTFTSVSHDPDGSIVATSWEFSDGREKVGTSVVYSFSYAGMHTVTLRVRDDAGAVAALDLSILVHAPLMQGRAFALEGPDGATFADTGDVETSQQTDHADAVGAFSYGALRVAGLDASLRTLDARAVARATVASVHIPVPIGYVLVTGIESEAIVGCDFPLMRSVKITQLRLNDAPLVPPGEVPPNTSVALPGGGTLALNVQERVGDRLASVALRLTDASGARVLEVAHAEAGVNHCPFA